MINSVILQLKNTAYVHKKYYDEKVFNARPGMNGGWEQVKENCLLNSLNPTVLLVICNFDP